MNTMIEESSHSVVIQCLEKYCEEELTDPSTLLRELNLESLDLIEGIFELENHFGKTLSNADLTRLNTVADLVETFSSTSDRPPESTNHHSAT